jgi:hypothetical protein
LTESQEKVCSICHEVKPLTEFYTQKKTNKNGSQWFYYNPECKSCTKKRNMEWQKQNPDKVLKNVRTQAKKRKEVLKQYGIDNRERMRETLRKWQHENPDKVKEHNEFRNKHKTHKINSKEWAACKAYFNNSCAYCGISDIEAREQLGNYLHKEHVDHNGSNDLSNCVPACKSCNSAKRQYELTEWYNESNEHFTPERLEKINKWLNDDYIGYIHN